MMADWAICCSVLNNDQYHQHAGACLLFVAFSYRVAGFLIATIFVAFLLHEHSLIAPADHCQPTNRTSW